MLGVIVAIIMAMFHISVDTIALFFIGMQLFDISLNLSYFRVKDKKRESRLNSAFEKLRKEMERDGGSD